MRRRIRFVPAEASVHPASQRRDRAQDADQARKNGAHHGDARHSILPRS